MSRADAIRYSQVKHIRITCGVDYYIAIKTREFVQIYGKPLPGTYLQRQLDDLVIRSYIEYMRYPDSVKHDYEREFKGASGYDLLMSST